MTIRSKPWLVLGLALLPFAGLLRAAAFRWPSLTERWYGQLLYPLVNRVLGSISGLVPISLAELVTVVGLVLGGFVLSRRVIASWRRRTAEESAWRWLGNTSARAAVGLWVVAGMIAWAFLLAWGLNYARPSLRERLQLDAAAIEADEVLALGRLSARRAAAVYRELGFDPEQPTIMPIDFAALNREIDVRLDELELPGDSLRGGRAPAKQLWASTILSYLGISGIYIPFTAEPSVNALVPDSWVPLAVAHEKAHQHGFTDEGEANLVAVLIAAGSDEPYLRYAAYLFVASRLIVEAGRYEPEQARAAWEILGPGPLRDLRANREFWQAYQGPATEVARRVNDAYLRSNRVPGGVQSYGRVVELLIGLSRRGEYAFLAVPEESE